MEQTRLIRCGIGIDGCSSQPSPEAKDWCAETKATALPCCPLLTAENPKHTGDFRVTPCAALPCPTVPHRAPNDNYHNVVGKTCEGMFSHPLPPERVRSMARCAQFLLHIIYSGSYGPGSRAAGLLNPARGQSYFNHNASCTKTSKIKLPS